MTTDRDPPLVLFNSLTRQAEPFHPVREGEARVYTCGPTVYNYPHIGNMRAYVFADVLGRTLSFCGYQLTHVINITDVGHLTDDADAGEDKMERMARTQAQSIWDIAEHYKQAYWADVRALNIRQPAQWTVATDYVPQMIAFAQGIAAQHCYELPSGTSTSRPWPIMDASRAPPRMRGRAGSRRSTASAIRPISRSGARPRRARPARWNGIRRGAAARRAGITNAR